MRRDIRLAVSAAFLGNLAACGGDRPTEPEAVASVILGPPTLSLVVGQTGTLTAQAKSSAGGLLTGRTMAWSTSDLAIATVSNAGLVTGVSVGTATISATSEGKTGTASISITPVPVASVTIAPPAFSLTVGGTQQLTATPRDASGTALVGRAIAWSTSDAGIATVSLQGVVSAVAVGSATITAVSEGKSGTAAITVNPSVPTVTVGSWTLIGPHHIPGFFAGRLDAGKLQAFAVSASNPNIMYTGGGLGSGNQGPYSEAGAFQTTDGGAQWTPINNGLTDPVVNALWVDPSNANTVLAGTETTGIFRSTDGGQSWAIVNSGVGTTSDFVAANGVLLAATHSGFAQSSDKGATWTVVLQTASTVRVLAAGGGAMIAGLENGTIMMQASPGAPWQTVLTNAGRTAWSVAVDPETPTTAFAVLGNHPSTLLRTTNGGLSWSTIIPPCTSANAPAQALLFTTGHQLFVGCNSDILRTNTAGDSWSNTWVSLDVRRVFAVPGTTSIVLGTDQGLHQTSDLGITVTSLSSSVHSSLLTSVSVNGSTIVTAVQDFSPIRSVDGGNSWQTRTQTTPLFQPPSGEDGQVLINPANANYCYAYTGNGYQYSTDGCRTVSFASTSGLGAGSYFQFGGANIMAVDPLVPSTVYAVAAAGVYKSVDFGVTMSPTAGWPSANVTAIAIDPTDSKVIYVGTSSGLNRTLDGGTTWSPLSLAGAAGFPTTIAVNPLNPQVVLVGLSGEPQGGGGVWRSTDRGGTFRQANTGITAARINCCTYQMHALRFNSNGIVALAASTGVYISADLGNSWRDIRANAVPRVFYDVAWDGGYLYGATFGSGVLRAPVTVTPSVLMHRDRR